MIELENGEFANPRWTTFSFEPDGRFGMAYRTDEATWEHGNVIRWALNLI